MITTADKLNMVAWAFKTVTSDGKKLKDHPSPSRSKTRQGTPANETVSQWQYLHICHSERSEESNKNKLLKATDSSSKDSE
jgi:hypothetical protein